MNQVNKAISTVNSSLAKANEFMENKNKDQAQIYAEAQAKKLAAEEAAAARKAEAEALK
jgi:hypothetical protein